jgi:hypothetical protein
MPETQASGLVQFLETIIDPVATALRNAPLDDEPRADDEKPLAEAKTWLQKNGGKGIPHAEAMRRLGLGVNGDQMDRRGPGGRGCSR